MVLLAPILFLFSTPSAEPKFHRSELVHIEVERGVCALVRLPEVAEALKLVAPRAHWETEREADFCKYRSEEGEVSVRVEHWDMELDARREFAALKSAFPDGKVRELTDLNVPAMVLDISGAGTEVFAIADIYDYVMVSVLGWSGTRDMSKIAEQLARAAVQRYESAKTSQ